MKSLVGATQRVQVYKRRPFASPNLPKPVQSSTRHLSSSGSWRRRLLDGCHCHSKTLPAPVPVSKSQARDFSTLRGDRKSTRQHSQDQRVIEVTKKLLASSNESEWPVVLQQHRYTVDSLLKGWSKLMKQYQQQQRPLRKPVEMVDDFVKRLVRSGISPSSNLDAVFTGISGWARISAAHVDAVDRATDLFNLIDASYGHHVPKFVKDRRNGYSALLLTLSRSKRSDAVDKAFALIEQMKMEQLQKGTYGFMNIHCYNYAMATCAARGLVDQVLELWEDAKFMGLLPDAVSYDCHVKAYQQRKDGESATRVFLEQLDAYTKYRTENGPSESMKPLPLTLGRVLTTLTTKEPLDSVRRLIEKALAFEDSCTECRGLVDLRVFGIALSAYSDRNKRQGKHLDEIEELFQLMVDLYEAGRTYLKPSRKLLGMFMDGYAQRSTEESLEKVESVLDLMEKRLLDSDPEAADMDCGLYNILMTAYLRTWPPDALGRIERTIERMNVAAATYQKPNLRPDEISWSILMKALVKQGEPGFQYKVQRIFDQLSKENGGEGVNGSVTYLIALDAWAKSDDPDNILRAEAIFKSIPTPYTQCCNVMMNIYARHGRTKEALALLERMKSNLSGQCGPDTITFASVFFAIRNEYDPDRWKKALGVFDDMMDLFQKGQRSCKPSEVAIASLFHVLAVSDEVLEKHSAAQRVRERLSSAGISFGQSASVAFIEACARTRGDEQQRREALHFMVDSLKSILLMGNWRVYRSVIEACHSLVDDEAERNKLVSETFRRCVEAGHVNDRVLQTLRDACSTEMYNELTSKQQA